MSAKIVIDKTKRHAKGITTIELIVVLSIVGILVGLASPAFFQWQKSIIYRTTAQEIVSALKDARGRSISKNLQHRIEFAPAGNYNQYQLQQGNRAANSTTWTAVQENLDFKKIPYVTSLVTSNTSSNSIGFNPNGSASIAAAASAATVTVRDADGHDRYAVEVTSAGRIRIK